jgi:hypothetical protein
MDVKENTRETKVKKEIPSGYRWRVENYADDEGIVVTVTLVASHHKEGTWRDRLFSRSILNSACEVSVEAEDEEIEQKVEELKSQISAVFFNWT